MKIKSVGRVLTTDSVVLGRILWAFCFAGGRGRREKTVNTQGKRHSEGPGIVTKGRATP